MQWFRALQNVLQLTRLSNQALRPDVTISADWEVLGPFQIGTREAAWSSDPLEYFGGFQTLEFDTRATFRTSLVPNGTTGWSRTRANVTIPPIEAQFDCLAELRVGFPHVDWELLQQAYGWAALQWQGWARGEIVVTASEPQVINIYVETILEFAIDGERYFGGDFYGFGRSPVTLRLDPGRHRLDVRLVRDVRSMGGIGDPSLDVRIRLEKATPGLGPVRVVGLARAHRQVLISDHMLDIGGRLAAEFASVTAYNQARDTIHVTAVQVMDAACSATLLSEVPLELVAGQTRPVGFRLSCEHLRPGSTIDIALIWSFDNSEKKELLHFTAFPKSRRLDEPTKITFVHPVGVVSYAILRVPTGRKHECLDRMPVMIALHGAGVEADSELNRHALDGLQHPCAWILFPTGGTPWSGDDWHQWGSSDIEAAVAAIPAWIEAARWNESTVDTSRWLVVGHSNGGQGVWYTLTHRPDKVFAAAALSGYASIPAYVPYTFWHPTDPGRMAIVQAAQNSYAHPLLLENARGIPLFQQHGALDTNVPAYHSRFLGQVLVEGGASSEYIEVAQQNHYWDGVLTTNDLAAFYEKQLSEPTTRGRVDSFTVVSANPGDSGSKHGVKIIHLLVPGRIGKLDLRFDVLTKACSVTTTNVQTFGLSTFWQECDILRVDSQEVTNDHNNIFQLSSAAQWQVDNTIPPLAPRMGRQLGSMDAILSSESAFEIVAHSSGAEAVVLQISRNLCQYYGADTHISNDYGAAKTSSGNVISVAIGGDLPSEAYGYRHAIEIIGGQLQVTDVDGVIKSWPGHLAAIYLRPLPGQRLELVVWGSDLERLRLAARLVPMLTGTGLPDFVIVDESMMWKGVEGAKALGFFDLEWTMSKNSFVV